MTRYLLAGGGTAGHVNPLLALADGLSRADDTDEVLVLGTQEGLESRLVPARGYELVTIPRLPFPRRPNGDALRFLPRLRRAIRTTVEIVHRRRIDAIVGFGGYAAAPAYFAARRAGVPLIVHEQNALPGLANRLGARRTPYVGVTFANTKLSHARWVGMPLRREIADLDRPTAAAEARDLFGLDASRPTLLVTGGSLGARRLNTAIAGSRDEILATGFQIIHVQGSNGELDDPDVDGYHLLDYCDRMDLALAIADVAVGRAGASTVSEVSALGIASILVPFPIGNGEQRHNAVDVVSAGGARLVDDAEFTPSWVLSELVPLLNDRERIRRMGQRAATVGSREGTENLVSLVHEALGDDVRWKS